MVTVNNGPGQGDDRDRDEGRNGAVAPRTVYHLDRQQGRTVAVAAEALVCDVCGADATTDEPTRGLFTDTGADGRALIRCRCGAVYYATDTPHLLSEGTLKLIALFMHPGRIATVADGTVTCRGWVPSGTLIEDRIPAGYQEQVAWRDSGYRRVWLAPQEFAILTFAEGDVMLDLYATQAAYDEAVRGATDYYRQ